MESARKLKRRGVVQELRALARECGVQQCRDDSGEAKVKAMLESIVSAASSENVTLARDAFRRYQECLHPEGRAETPAEKTQEQVATASSFRLRGTSFLLTFNWDFFGKPLPDGTKSPASAEELWSVWCSWRSERARTLGVKQSTSTLEASLNSELAGRVHLHWKVNLEKSVDTCDVSPFAFHGVRPDFRTTQVAARADTRKARGANFFEASNRTHFYTYVEKVGTLSAVFLYKGSTLLPPRAGRECAGPLFSPRA